MLLNHLLFIFAFLPVVLLVYYLMPDRFKNPVLLTASLFFYAWGDPVYLLLLIFAVVFHYGMGQHLERMASSKRQQKMDLIFCVAVDVFLLCFFKYYGTFTGILNQLFHLQISGDALALPIGLSFYTFKNLSYLLDIYSGKVKAEKNFFAFSVYASMFPSMTSGPILRYADLKEELKAPSVKLTNLGYGAQRFLVGFGKKVLLADTLAMLYDTISASGTEISVLTAWIGMLAYTMQIYYDFSGYSDMAVGIGKMLGFTFKENFDYPYQSKSITEFWRRWHISLGSWFRDYIYIPLGGNRVSKGKQIRNILVVWCLTGMWHGATLNFAAWGLYYGLLLLLEKFVLGKLLDKLPGWLSGTYTMLLVMAGWMLFSHYSLAEGLSCLMALVGIGTTGWIDYTALYYLKTNAVLLIICIAAAGPWLSRKIQPYLRSSIPVTAFAYGLLLILCTACMVFRTYQPFLYLRF